MRVVASGGRKIGVDFMKGEILVEMEGSCHCRTWETFLNLPLQNQSLQCSDLQE